jgi:hypothetical protein
MTGTRPSIDQILASFFAARLEDSTGLRRRRIEGVERRLRGFLEADGECILPTGDRALLQLERQFGGGNAFARTMHADDLLFALRLFLAEPWLPGDVQDRRVQLSTVDALVFSLLERRLVDRHELACPLLQLQVAIDDAKAALRRGSRDLRDGPARRAGAG